MQLVRGALYNAQILRLRLF